MVSVVVISGLLAFIVSSSAAVVIATVCLAGAVVSTLLWYSIQARNDETSRTLQTVQQELYRFHESSLNLQQGALQATTALSKMRDGVVMLSESREILLINPAARMLLDLDADEPYIGRVLEDVVRLPDVLRAVVATSSGSGTQSVNMDASSHGLPHPIQCRIDQITATSTSSLLMTLRDDTEVRRVDEMRREFVANISHELKTPLAAIKGYAETVELAIKDDPSAAIYFMSQINAQCLRLERLVADMMQLARVQAGPENLSLGRVRLREVIADSLKAYRPIADAKNISLIVEPHPDAEVRADPDATLTIANNLIGNAIHYTPSGGRVSVTCRAVEDQWALVVADNGVGIAEDEQERIFERFYRVEKNRGSASGGTGIGLSMVKNLVSAMGGEVLLRSTVGEGSVFEVLLPINDQ